MKLRKNEARWVEKERRWKINVTNDEGVRRTFNSDIGLSSRKGKLQAERKADEWLENGLKSKTVRVSDAFEQYMEHLKKTTSEGNWKPCASIGKTWILPRYGNKKVSALTEGDCERIVADAYVAGRTKRYIVNIRNCISGFLKYCRKNNLCTLAPEELNVPKGAKETQRFVLTKEEIRTLFEPCDWWYIHTYRFLLLSDLRPGELIGLQWKDFDGDSFTVNRAINSANQITDGKNFNAHRTLTLTSLAMKEIQEQRDMLRTAGIVSPWVFPTSRGGHIMQNKLRTYWYEYCDKMGICRRTTKYGEERYITPYEFRHTCYSVNKDMPDTLKKMAFGHSRSFDGDRVYNHEMDGDRERIAEYSQAAFIQILCPQE